MHKIHLDTDLGGDIDDLCALALLLRSRDVVITGITTVAEASGRRAGYVRYALAIEGRGDIPVAAGADVAGGHYRYAELDYPAEDRYWPQPIAPSPNASEEAIDLLERSVEQGATIVAIGPFTNLRLLEERHPGILMQAELTLMGGYVYPIRPGFPQWGNEDDWNLQVDVTSARYVLQHSRPSLVPLTVTVETALRRGCLEKLRDAGALGRLIAQQAEVFAVDERNESRFGETCSGLPSDIINFQHDALACAIALGWRDGVTIEQRHIQVEDRDGFLVERIVDGISRAGPLPGSPEATGRYAVSTLFADVVTRIDGPRFNDFWLHQVTGG